MVSLLKLLIADFHANPVPKGLIKRDLIVPTDAGKMVSVIGPRRAGKSWFLFSLIEDLIKSVDIKRVVYINFEDERLSFKAESLGLIVDAYQQLYPDQPLNEVFFFFDEIQEVAGWEKFVRRMTDSISPHLFVIGSSAKLLSREIATTLRGRTLPYTLLPYSFREYLRVSGEEPDSNNFSSAMRNRLTARFEVFVQQGGYPEVVRFDEATRLKTLQTYFDVMLYRDVVDRFNVRRPHLVKDFARRLVANNAQLFSVNKYYRDLKSRSVSVTKDTLYSLIDHFVDACFVTAINKYDESEAKQSQALKKYYVNDTGLINACEFVPAEKAGAMFESAVMLELLKRDKHINYFADKGECDCVVVERGVVREAIQVCHTLTESNLAREIAGLSGAMQRFGLPEGLLLTMNQCDQYETASGVIKVMPAWEWALKL